MSDIRICLRHRYRVAVIAASVFMLGTVAKAENVSSLELSSIDSSGVSVIDSSGGLVIDSSGGLVIDSSGGLVIDSSGGSVIDSSGIISKNTSLLLFAQVTSIDKIAGTATLLGNDVALAGVQGATGLRAGDFVAFYGSHTATGQQFESAKRVGGYELTGVARSYVSGIVDAIDYSIGQASVGGFAVDYTSLLSMGMSLRPGDFLEVYGFGYDSVGLVASHDGVGQSAIR